MPLVEHSRVQLYPDRQTHQTSLKRGQTQLAAPQSHTEAHTLLPNTPLIWDGRLWTLVNLGETTTILLPTDGQPIQLPSAFFLQLLLGGTIRRRDALSEGTANQLGTDRMNAASPADLKEANRRFQKVMAYLQPEAPEITSDIPKRTLSRWVKQFREAEIKYGCGYIGLLPRTQERGNRTAKAPTKSRELLDTIIGSHFETPRQAPAASVYLAYQRACEQQNIPPLSRRTFYQRLKQRNQNEQTEKRQGAKAAYRTQPWHWELTPSTPRHGDRPLALVHIDHTQMDVELRTFYWLCRCPQRLAYPSGGGSTT